MEYTEGYLAFLDILGFSKYVENEENGERTADLFDFIDKFCYLFNSSPQLEVQTSFFSDTVIITSKDLQKLITPIIIAESYLKDELGLLFRGSIVFGKYYHNNGNTFGPAVVSGYMLEKKAIYSRILIEDEIKTDERSIFFYTDIDGNNCLNPYGMLLNEIILYGGEEGAVYPENVTDELKDALLKRRDELLRQIEKNVGSAVVDKYLWRIRPYNYTCKFFRDLPCGEIIYDKIGYVMNEELKQIMTMAIISENEVFDRQ